MRMHAREEGPEALPAHRVTAVMTACFSCGAMGPKQSRKVLALALGGRGVRVLRLGDEFCVFLVAVHDVLG